MKKMTGISMDLVAENIAQLKTLFPEAVTEGKIDFEVLRNLLGGEIEERQEYYKFTWSGKEAARAYARTPSMGTLRPCEAESSGRDGTPGRFDSENLYIEGDNLEVLKLLQGPYHKRVKMIYIDPPYNTGKDFVYPDNFRDSLANYKKITGQTDAEGASTRANPETSGRYHTDWLNMMYPRLILARNLLTDDGVIFISIDDAEIANLTKLCDDVFGEENYAGTWFWYKSSTPPNLSHKIKRNIEYVIAYTKSADNNSFFRGIQKNSKSDDPFTKPQNSLKRLIFPPRSIHFRDIAGFLKAGVYGTERFPNTLVNDIEIENGLNKQEAIFENRFIWTQEKLEAELNSGTIVNCSKQLVLSYKKSEYAPEVPPSLIDESVHVHTTEEAGKKLDLLMGGKRVFDYPKPVSLLQYILSFCDAEIILDFFSGSATTAHAAMQLNAKLGGFRKYIMVQLPEKIDIKTDTGKNAIKFCEDHNLEQNICSIAKERIRRAAKKIREELQEKQAVLTSEATELRKKRAEIKKGTLPGTVDTSELDAQIEELEAQIANAQKALAGDMGFKVFKLDTSNMVPWNPNAAELRQSLIDAVDNVLADRSTEDLLYEVLLKCNLPPTLPVEEKKIGENTVYIVGAGALAICLDKSIPQTIAEEIVKLRDEYAPIVPMQVVFRDNGFTDVAKTNALQILKQAGFEEKSVQTI